MKKSNTNFIINFIKDEWRILVILLFICVVPFFFFKPREQCKVVPGSEIANTSHPDEESGYYAIFKLNDGKYCRVSNKDLYFMGKGYVATKEFNGVVLTP